MASTALSQDADLIGAIERSIQGEADRLHEVGIRAAVEKFEADLRASLAKSAVKVMDYYEMERRDHNLVITVKMGAKS